MFPRVRMARDSGASFSEARWSVSRDNTSRSSSTSYARTSCSIPTIRPPVFFWWEKYIADQHASTMAPYLLNIANADACRHHVPRQHAERCLPLQEVVSNLTQVRHQKG